MKNIYEYQDYREFIVDLISSKENAGRGQRKALAKAAGAQLSHISAVLSGKAHFSLEQGEAAARFLGLNNEETEFFFLLVQFERAGSAALRKFLLKLLNERRGKSTLLKKRLPVSSSLRHEQEARYYSSWQYAMVHVALSIPALQTREALCEHLHLPMERVDEILRLLVELGLAEKVNQRFQILEASLHLAKDSPFITKHHINWRLKAILSLDHPSEEDTHYSSVLTISKSDYPKVREIFIRALAESMEIIRKSPEEKLATLCIDFFAL